MTNDEIKTAVETIAGSMYSLDIIKFGESSERTPIEVCEYWKTNTSASDVAKFMKAVEAITVYVMEKSDIEYTVKSLRA